MIVWLNGAYGAGKSTTARELVGLLPTGTLYDPGATGQHLLSVLPADRLEDLSGYQELASWRRLVAETAAALLAETGGLLVVPATLLRQEHRDEIFGALASHRIPVRHLLLHADETILRARAKQRDETAGRSEARPPHAWSRDHLTTYQRARAWLSRDAHVVDTSRLTARQVALRVKAAVRDGAGACEIVQSQRPAGETLAAGVLLFDAFDRVLLVDPTYKPGWEFPGGVVEHGEAPARAAVREVLEELGISLAGAGLPLLVVDWEPPRSPRFGGLRLLFDGGLLGPERVAELTLPPEELRDWRFVTEDQARGMLPPERFARLRWALRAREAGRTVNLEAGEAVTGPSGGAGG